MDGHMELRLLDPTEDGFLRKIEWNRSEIESEVKRITDEYKGLAYTEDTIPDAKKDRAYLRKLIDSLEDRRKLVKKKLNEPYETFEAEVKEVVGIVQKQVDSIDKQIKDYEERQKKEKEARLREFYKENIGDLEENFPFEKFFDSRYLNASFAERKAQGEIKDKIMRVLTDMSTIESLDSKYTLNVKDVYIRTLDLSKALAENKRLTDLEARMEAERKKREEAEQKRKEEQEAERRRIEAEKAEMDKKAAESEKSSDPESGSGDEKIVAEQGENVSEKGSAVNAGAESVNEKAKDDSDHQQAKRPQQTKRYKATFYAIGTLEQLQELSQYMTEKGIEFGKVEK